MVIAADRLRGVLRGPGRRAAVGGGVHAEGLVEMAVPGDGPVEQSAAEGGHRHPAERAPPQPEQEHRPAQGRRGGALRLADIRRPMSPERPPVRRRARPRPRRPGEHLGISRLSMPCSPHAEGSRYPPAMPCRGRPPSPPAVSGAWCDPLRHSPHNLPGCAARTPCRVVTISRGVMIPSSLTLRLTLGTLILIALAPHRVPCPQAPSQAHPPWRPLSAVSRTGPASIFDAEQHVRLLAQVLPLVIPRLAVELIGGEVEVAVAGHRQRVRPEHARVVHQRLELAVGPAAEDRVVLVVRRVDPPLVVRLQAVGRRPSRRGRARSPRPASRRAGRRRARRRSRCRAAG